MSETKKQSMNGVDAAWWRMEDPTNLMMVTGMMYFETPVQRDELITIFRERLLCFDRFRQRVLDPHPSIKSPVWEEVEVDMDYHVTHERLPDPGGYDLLRDKAGEYMGKPLDYNRPLWQVHIVDNCGSGNAILVRTHHTIADGIALVGVMLAMTDSNDEKPKQPRRSKLSPAGQLFKLAGDAIANASKTTGNILDAITHPQELSHKVMDAAKKSTHVGAQVAKMGTKGAMSTAKLVLLPPDPSTPFKGELGIPKLATWSDPIPLDDIKKIKNVTKTTVNDVLLTAMSGGLRRYLQSRNENVDGLEFRAAVPVNLRDPAKFSELGNKFGLVFLPLPVGIEDSLERLFQLKRNMDVIKESPDAVVAFGILKAMGLTPTEVQKLVVSIFGTKSTAVMTNVPGPKEHLYLAGKKVDHMMFWVPRSGRLGLGVSILSYAGSVRLGVAVDGGLVPDPEKIIQGFHDELDEMMTLVTQVED